MAKRLKVGLIFSYNENWIGGAYYLLNVMHALKTLPDAEKPELTIITFKEEDYKRVAEIEYPYIKSFVINETDYYLKHYWYERGINTIWRKLTKKNLIERDDTIKRIPKVDVLFPANSNHIIYSSAKNRLLWIPDFQHVFLPDFFSAEEVEQRNTAFKDWATKTNPILFSSQNALTHFKQLYPSSTTPLFVLNFAVTHPLLAQLDVKVIRAKYNLPEKYYLSPNQFWAHKNHKVVIEAVKHLKDAGTSLTVAFTGKEDDYRNPTYTQELKKLVADYKLEKEIRFLGFIDRAEQLLLLKDAIAVLQPSLFEGWSTVIEDAKALNQFVIASDIEVHQEQNDGNIIFFEPTNSLQLAERLQTYFITPPVIKKQDYKTQVSNFGKNLMAILNQIVQKN